MDRGRQGISEFFLRHRYNYICEALGLQNPSAPFRTISTVKQDEFWKDLHKSPKQIFFENQDGADDDTYTASQPEAYQDPEGSDDAYSMNTFKRALMALRSKEDVFRTRLLTGGQLMSHATSIKHPISDGCSEDGVDSLMRMGEKEHMLKAGSRLREEEPEAVLLSRLDDVGDPGLELEAMRSTVVVGKVVPGSSAALSSHPIRPGDEVRWKVVVTQERIRAAY